MKLGQAVLETGERAVLLIEEGLAVALPPAIARSTIELVAQCDGDPARWVESLRRFRRDAGAPVATEDDLLAGRASARLLKPIDPPEVWATGVTYKRQAVEHDKDLVQAGKPHTNLYSYVHESRRAEVFFKGFNRTLAGPGEPIGLRADSHCVLPEAELVAVLSADGRPLAYTAGNDVTCWDIELDCPLFLSQAKIFDHCASIGPFLVAAEDFDPYAVSARCSVLRGGAIAVESRGTTEDLKRSIEEMIHFLRFNNTTPAGTLLFTGTTCVMPHDFSLEHGDQVLVDLEGIGRLVNPTLRLPQPVPPPNLGRPPR